MRVKIHIVVVIAAAILVGCTSSLFAQEKNQGNSNPNVHISVHKQTDANGNVISYDSTYSYTYSGKCCHSDAYVDSIMRKYGLDMNSLMLAMPLNTPDLTNYPLIQQFGVMDFDKMQQMMQNQMNEMMQIYGMPPCNGFFCQPPPTPQCCPKDSMHYQPQRLEKKSCPKHNKASGGVQI